MEPILTRLQNGEQLAADGAMGTELYARGLARGGCPELINLTQADLLIDIASSYAAAGADIIQTNTFGASPVRLAEYHLIDKTEEINTVACQAVRQAVGNSCYISGICGPSGKTLKPYGDAEPDEIRASFTRQISALLSAGVDHITIETMMDLSEAVLAIEATRSISKTIPVMATMTYNQTPRGYFTLAGNTIKETVETLSLAGADVVGANCGAGISQMIEIATEFIAHTSRPLLIQANAGLPQMLGNEAIYSETPEMMAPFFAQLAQLGVSIIGGCCGTTPAHVRAINEAISAGNSH